MKRLRHVMSVHEPGTVRSPADDRQAAQRRPPQRVYERTLTGRQDRAGEVVVDKPAFGWLVLLDGHLNHRAEGGLRGGVSRHQRLLTYPASTGNATPVT